MGFFVSLVGFVVRRWFLFAGLRPETFRIDADTTIHCWLSQSLLPAPAPASTNLGSSATTASNSKPVLLLIHGFGPKGIFQWWAQARALVARFDLVVPDLLFFGGSSTRSAARSEAFQATCLAGLMDAIIGSEREFSVAGTSYGGFVAYHMAHMCRERVRRVVLASSDMLKAEGDDCALAARSGVERVSDLLLPRNTQLLRTLIQLSVYRRPRLMPEFVLRDVLQSLYKDNREEKLELLKAITLGNKDEFQLTPLPQEVLIIWGEHDQIFPLEKAFELKKRLGEKARLEIIKNTGHIPQAEDPRRFNEILISFLLGSPRSSM